MDLHLNYHESPPIYASGWQRRQHGPYWRTVRAKKTPLSQYYACLTAFLRIRNCPYKESLDLLAKGAILIEAFLQSTLSKLKWWALQDERVQRDCIVRCQFASRAPQELRGRRDQRRNRLSLLQELDSGGLVSPLSPNLELVCRCFSVCEAEESIAATCSLVRGRVRQSFDDRPPQALGYSARQYT